MQLNADHLWSKKWCRMKAHWPEKAIKLDENLQTMNFCLLVVTDIVFLLVDWCFKLTNFIATRIAVLFEIHSFSTSQKMLFRIYEANFHETQKKLYFVNKTISKKFLSFSTVENTIQFLLIFQS